MSEKLMQFFGLAETSVIRLICKYEDCGAVVELPFNQLDKQFDGGCCKVCGKDFHVMENRNMGHGANWLKLFAQSAIALKRGGIMVDIEFSIPVKEVCRLDRKE
jgi:hypothetical protein